MPFSINWEKEGIVTTFYGVVTAEDIVQADRDFYEDPRSDNIKYQITDYSKGTPSLINAEDVIEIAASDFGASHSIPSMKIAFITTSQHVMSLCNQYIDLLQSLHSGWEFLVCENMQSAREWISK